MNKISVDERRAHQRRSINLDLQGTHLGLILLYTAFNLSLAVWLMKGFIDDIPRAYEEADLDPSLVGYVVRMEAFKGVRKNLSGIVAFVIGAASLLGLSDFSALLPTLDVGRAWELMTLGGGLLGIRDR